MFQSSSWQLYLVVALLGIGILTGLYFIFRKKLRFLRKQREIKKLISDFELRREVRIFISYAHADSALFHIPKIAKILEKIPEMIL